MSNSDPRKAYIANCVRTLLQVQEFPKSFLRNSVLDDFLNSATLNAVQIFQNNQGEIIVAKLDTDNESSDSLGAVSISKIRNGEIDDSNYKDNLLVNRMSGNPIISLLGNLKNVYLPAFQNKDISQKLDPNVKRLLDELQAGLDRTVLKSQSQSSSFTVLLCSSDCYMLTRFRRMNRSSWISSLRQTSLASGKTLSRRVRVLP